MKKIISLLLMNKKNNKSSFKFSQCSRCSLFEVVGFLFLVFNKVSFTLITYKVIFFKFNTTHFPLETLIGGTEVDSNVRHLV